MMKQNDPGALTDATGAGGDQARGDKLLDTTNGRVAPALTKPLAEIGQYKLTQWERCVPSSSGCVGTATVRLPSGKYGVFDIYNLSPAFAEWGPTAWLPRKIQSNNMKELSAACPVAVELVRQFDPEVLSKPFTLLPAKRKGAGQ